jgi:arsenite transporter
MSKPPPLSDEVTESSPPILQVQDLGVTSDPEKQPEHAQEPSDASKKSAFNRLGWLDRFLALWIFLAMAVGIILGAFVPNTGPALQKETFVGVSVPIGKCCLTPPQIYLQFLLI